MTDAFRDAAPAWAGGPYSIKRHGVTVTTCDSEPVQTPGCIQAHGVLLVLRPEDRVIRQVSENCERLLGRAPGELLDARLATVLGAEVDAKIAAMLAGEPIDGNPMHVLTLDGRGEVPALELVLHTCDRAALLELEPAVADRRGPTDDYAFVTRSVARLQSSSTLLGFCQLAADEVRALTGLDRVMIYKFHDDGHGEVFAESRPGELPSWLGLHYPAEDIPRPAREIFRQIWIRPVPDARAELAELVPLCHPDTGKPLTMTYCALRGPSVMYTEYLENMGVRASLTMPIRRDQELWGLIACHHREPAYLPYPIRAACELMAQVVSLQHKAAEDREHVVYRMKVEGVHQQLVAVAAQEGGLATMIDASPNLLDGMDASGAALFHRDRWWCAGRVPAVPELEELRRWLVDRPELRSPTHPLYATDALARDYPPATALTAVASGLLAVSLSRAHHDLMLWFRPETIATVQWGGNPHDMPTVPGPHGPRLTPRHSFELFVESVRGRSRPWRTAELEAALRLRWLVTELVIGRAEHLARMNVELTRSNEELDAFAYVASHDLKEPLRSINKYAHQLLDDALEVDAERRGKLESLVRLTVRMDSLLDALLEFSRVGRTPLDLEDVDLGTVVEEAIEIVEARRAERGVTIVIPRPLPVVPGDRIRLRQVFVNLLANAIKYNDRAEKRVEIGYIAPDERPAGAVWPAATGHTTVYVKDNGIGIEPRHHAQVFEIFRRLHGRDEFGGGAGAGLTIVKKVLAAHGGHVWLDSEVGVGSTFYVSLPTRRGT
ncbi:MAG TPA: ATP-binding protein [Kofleriaceae bacterium]